MNKIIFSILAVLISFVATASARVFQCDNTIYVSSRALSSTTTELFTLNPLTAEKIRDINTTNVWGYDAIAFNHKDGYIYGMANGSVEYGYNPHVVRIDPVQGNVSDVGTLPELEGKEWIVGAIMKDGTYVIGDFETSSWLHVNLETLEILGQGTFPTMTPSAWATNPLDNVIYGYNTYEQKLISFDPYTRNYQLLGNQLDNVGFYPCSNAFMQDGSMYLYCWSANPEADVMYTVNLQNFTALKIAEGPKLGAGNMATCAFKKDEPTPNPEPEPEPDPRMPGTWQKGKHCLEISENGNIRTYDLCGPFKCKQRSSTLSTYASSGSRTNNWALAKYSGRPQTLQELEIVERNTLRVTEMDKYRVLANLNNWDRDDYRKVKKCRLKFPVPPIPHPHPKPTPNPKPTPSSAILEM